MPVSFARNSTARLAPHRGEHRAVAGDKRVALAATAARALLFPIAQRRENRGSVGHDLAGRELLVVVAVVLLRMGPGRTNSVLRFGPAGSSRSIET